MRILLLVISFLISTAVSAQQFDQKELIQNLKTFSSDSFGGRKADQEGGEKSRNFVSEKFQTLELQSFSDDYFQEFVIQRRDEDPYSAYNVIGFVRGSVYPNRYVVISAHHDHLGTRGNEIYNGADDNGSGTCALFAIAEYFTKYAPRVSIIFVAFDAEEIGFQGARAFIENPPVDIKDILINFNMDMIGRNDNNEIYVAGTSHHPELKDLFEGINSPLNVLFGHDGNDGKQNWTFSSDHAVFHRKEIPFLYFGEEDHEDYHRPTDTFEGIQPEYYLNAVELVLNVTITFDHSVK